MYKEHIKESYGRNYLENEYGYITWEEKDDACIINSLYIKKEFRNKGKGSILADLAIEKSGKKNILCEIDTASNTYLEAYTSITKYGFKPIDLYGRYLILGKEL